MDQDDGLFVVKGDHFSPPDPCTSTVVNVVEKDVNVAIVGMLRVVCVSSYCFSLNILHVIMDNISILHKY